MSDVEITRRLYQALAETYPVTEGSGALRRALLTEVRDSTGFGSSRSCDAFVAHFWPSDGLRLDGFEVKASRSDWLRELKDPSKAHMFAQHCDRWYIVAPSTDVVHIDEVPAGWGLLVLNAKGKLHHAVPASVNANPQPISRAMLMSIVRAAAAQTWNEQVAVKQKEIEARVRIATDRELHVVKDQLSRLQAVVKEFEEASGLALESTVWRGEARSVGETVRVVRNVLKSGFGGAIDTVTKYGTALRSLAEQCERAAEELRVAEAQEQSRHAEVAA